MLYIRYLISYVSDIIYKISILHNSHFTIYHIRYIISDIRYLIHYIRYVKCYIQHLICYLRYLHKYRSYLTIEHISQLTYNISHIENKIS